MEPGAKARDFLQAQSSYRVRDLRVRLLHLPRICMPHGLRTEIDRIHGYGHAQSKRIRKRKNRSLSNRRRRRRTKARSPQANIITASRYFVRTTKRCTAFTNATEKRLQPGAPRDVRLARMAAPKIISANLTDRWAHTRSVRIAGSIYLTAEDAGLEKLFKTGAAAVREMSWDR